MLSRDDMKPRSRTHVFDALPDNVKRLLIKAATKGLVESTAEMLACIEYDWLMVPTKKGLVQVVIRVGKAFRI